jgi:hypothetical protein
MAQKLHAIQLVPNKPQGFQMSTKEFWLGWSEAVRNEQVRPRFDLRGVPSEGAIVDIVRNLCELYFDDELDEGTLHHDCGLIVGFIVRGLYQSLACE